MGWDVCVVGVEIIREIVDGRIGVERGGAMPSDGAVGAIVALKLPI